MSNPCLNEKELQRLAESEKTLFEAVDGRVKWTMFWAILVVVFGLLTGIVGNIYSQLDDAHKATSALNTDFDTKISEIRIAQAKIDVQYAQIQKQLAEIQVQLEKLR